jgi:hypothetical protein
MIRVEGFMAFHGDMKITLKNKMYPTYYITNKDWLYRPDTDCWYGDGRSFPAEVCEPIEKN